MKGQYFIIGGGGTAKDVVAGLRGGDKSVAGVIVPDNEREQVSKWFGGRILSDDEFYKLVKDNSEEKISVVVAISNNDIRKKIVDNLLQFSNIVFPIVYLGNEEDGVVMGKKSLGEVVGRGSIIYPGVLINEMASIGEFVLINYGVYLPHDVVVGDFSVIEINASIGGGVEIGKKVTVAEGSVILPGSKIGDNAIVGLGAVVMRNVPSGATVLGNPAKVVFKR